MQENGKHLDSCFLVPLLHPFWGQTLGAQRPQTAKAVPGELNGEVGNSDMTKISSENRRKERRTAVDDNVYVVIDTQPEMMGQMVEISSAGMAFTFVDLDSVSQRLKGRDILRMDFFAAGRGYFIRNLPGRLVSTTETPSANAISSLMIKRIGVEFTSLSVSQQVQVNSLIRRQNEQEAMRQTSRRPNDA